jgi:hypothetical protein
MRRWLLRLQFRLRLRHSRRADSPRCLVHLTRRESPPPSLRAAGKVRRRLTRRPRQLPLRLQLRPQLQPSLADLPTCLAECPRRNQLLLRLRLTSARRLQLRLPRQLRPQFQFQPSPAGLRNDSAYSPRRSRLRRQPLLPSACRPLRQRLQAAAVRLHRCSEHSAGLLRVRARARQRRHRTLHFLRRPRLRLQFRSRLRPKAADSPRSSARFPRRSWLLRRLCLPSARRLPRPLLSTLDLSGLDLPALDLPALDRLGEAVRSHRCSEHLADQLQTQARARQRRRRPLHFPRLPRLRLQRQLRLHPSSEDLPSFSAKFRLPKGNRHFRARLRPRV